VLVEPGSSAALSAAFIDLLGDPARRAAVGRRAYEHSRRMIWSEVGAEYQRLFARVAAKPVPASAILARSSAAYVDA
jgi:hypothetical protein